MCRGHKRIRCLNRSGVVSGGKGEGEGELRGVAVMLVRGGSGLVKEEGEWSVLHGGESPGVLTGEVSFSGVAS